MKTVYYGSGSQVLSDWDFFVECVFDNVFQNNYSEKEMSKFLDEKKCLKLIEALYDIYDSDYVSDEGRQGLPNFKRRFPKLSRELIQAIKEHFVERYVYELDD